MYSPRSMSSVTPSSARVSLLAGVAGETFVIPSRRMSGIAGSGGAASSGRALLRFHQLTGPSGSIGRTPRRERWHKSARQGKHAIPGPRMTRDNIPVFLRENQPRKGLLMTPRRFLPALLLLFVGSGCAALIYEIVWFQLLQLVIGSSAVSMGVLLGTFMGGMCLGSFLLPRYVGRDAPSAAGLRLARAWHRRVRPAGAVRHAAGQRRLRVRVGRRRRVRHRDARRGGGDHACCRRRC